MKRFLIAFAFIAALAGGGIAYQGAYMGAAESKPAGPQVAPAVPVLAASVERKPMPVRIETIGTVQPLASIAIKSRTDGQIEKVAFREGQNVTAGDVLFTLDSRAAAAQVREAEAVLARDRAQLANARREVDRQAELVKKKFASGQKYDEVRTTAAALEASVKADEAALENLKVQLSYYTIRSPIDGRTGAVTLKAGSNVKANDTVALVTINRIRPIYVAFSAPQRELIGIREALSHGPLATIVQPVGKGAVKEKGKLAFIDNQIDATTGTITLKSVFPNEDERLWPGQFVNVALLLRVDADALTVPAPAVLDGQNGSYVYVINSDQVVEPREVVVERRVDGQCVIAKGVAAGEKVVVDGQLRLTKGTRVEAKPYTPPQAQAAS